MNERESDLSDNELTEMLDKHQTKMDNLIDEGHGILKKLKEMGKEIDSDLKAQNIIINNIGETMARTDSIIKKNNSRIDDIINKTSTCTLIASIVIQILIIIFLLII